MDNIIIEKIWNDSDISNTGLFEVKLTCITEYITINENVYMKDSLLKEFANIIEEYIANNKETYFEIPIKEGHTPGFEMKILPFDKHGHIQIEMKMEIDDNDKKLHFAIFCIKTEIGLLEKFRFKLNKLLNLEIGEKIFLNFE